MESLKTKILLFSVLTIVTYLSAFAQTDENMELLRDIKRNFYDSIVEYQILVSVEEIKLDDDLTYYWYKNDIIHKNKASYSGYLLHGQYTCFDRKENLVVEGNYEYGLREGIWRQWHSNGEIKSIIKWKKGIRKDASIYDRYGRIVKHIKYDADNKVKKVIEYYPVKKKIKYKNGFPREKAQDKTKSESSRNDKKAEKQKEDRGIEFRLSKILNRSNKSNSEDESGKEEIVE